MSRDFQSAFELYVEGNETIKRPRTRSISSQIPPLKEQDNTKCDTDMVSRKHSSKSRAYHKSRSFSTSNLRKLIHKNNSLQRKSVRSKSHNMSFRIRHHVTDGLSNEAGRKQSFKEHSGFAGESQKRSECNTFVTESKTSEHSDSMAAKVQRHDTVSLGRDEAVGTGGSGASANNLSQHSRLVVKITQKKFCQLKCIDMEPQTGDAEEKPMAMSNNSDRWLRKSRSRTDVDTKLVRSQSGKSKMIDKSWSGSPGRRIVQSKVLKSKLTKSGMGKQSVTLAKSLRSESKEEIVSSDAVTEAGSQLEQRPRRNIVPKKLSDTSGLSWKEETDLKKALYASLQKQRSSKVEPGTRGVLGIERPEKFSAVNEVVQRRTSDSKLKSEQQGTVKSTADWSVPIGANKRNSQTVETNSRLSTRSSSSLQPDCSIQMNYKFLTRSNASQKADCSNLWANPLCDWMDGACHKTDILYAALASDKRIESSSQVRAQRKFAHSSRPGTPTLALRKKVNQNGPRKDCKSKTVATEDFLTFLCLRGTDLLPPHLDLFNYSESESLQSFPNTPHESPDVSQPDTPSPDPPPLPFQEPGPSSAFPSKQLSDIRKLPKACHSLKVVSTVPPPPLSSSGCHSQLTQTTLAKKSQTRPSLQPVNGPTESKTLLPFHSVVNEVTGNLRGNVKKLKSVESKINTEKQTVDMSSTGVGSSSPDLGHSKSLDNQTQKLSGDDQLPTTGKDCSPDSSQNVVACEKESLQTLTPSEQGTSCLDGGSENRSRPTTRSRTAALMQKQLTMAQMGDDGGDVPQETKDGSKDKMAAVEDIVKKQLGSSSASSSVSSSQQNSDLTDCPGRDFQRQKFISGKSTQEPSHSGSFYRRLTRKRCSSSSQDVGDAHSRPANEPEQRSFTPKTKRRRITGCKSRSWRKLRQLRSMSSPPSCKQGSESSKEALNETRNCTESEGDVAIVATRKNKTEQQKEGGVTGDIAEGPTYHPSTEQFQDPVRYIDSISPHAIPYGLCRIIPPEGSWEVECCLSDDLSFKTEVQCINRFRDKSYMKIKMMANRLGKKFSAMRNWLTEVIGKVDGKALIEAVDKHEGFAMLQSQDNWAAIGSLLGIEDVKVLSLLPDLYCHYYLESLGITVNQEEEEEPCSADTTEDSLSKETKESCVIGSSQLNSQVRSRTLRDFVSFAKAFESSFDGGAEHALTSCEIEKMFWDLLEKSGARLEVETARIDTKQCGSAFPSKNDVPYSEHEWNFNVLQHNPNSILNCLGSISDVTVPVLQIGMRFSSSSWSQAQHHLPFIHYLHSGSDVIWYCVRAADVEKLRTALADASPDFFIPTTNPMAFFETPPMVSPETLALRGISMSRVVQKRGQFVVVFPESVTCNISCGYNVAEILHFATPDWIPVGQRAVELLHSSRSPELFSMDHLLLQMAKSSTDLMTPDAARILLTCLDNELQQRTEMFQLGLKCFEAIPARRLNRIHRERQTARCHVIQDEEKRCITCARICHISMLVDETHDLVFCLKHGIQYLKEHQRASFSKLLYRFDEKTLTGMTIKLRAQLEDGPCNSMAIGTDIKKERKFTKKRKF